MAFSFVFYFDKGLIREILVLIYLIKIRLWYSQKEALSPKVFKNKSTVNIKSYLQGKYRENIGLSCLYQKQPLLLCITSYQKDKDLLQVCPFCPFF